MLHTTIADLFATFDTKNTGELSAAEFHGMMKVMNNGKPVSDWAVRFVLDMAEVNYEEVSVMARVIQQRVSRIIIVVFFSPSFFFFCSSYELEAC